MLNKEFIFKSKHCSYLPHKAIDSAVHIMLKNVLIKKPPHVRSNKYIVMYYIGVSVLLFESV